jgi:hypothetical protein
MCFSGKEDLAYKDLSTAIELDANFYQAYYNRGTLLKRLGKSDQAQQDRLIQWLLINLYTLNPLFLTSKMHYHDYKQQRYSLYPVQWP